MCKSWQENSKNEELTITEIERMFSDDFFRKIENVIISGGEPILREDLPEIIRIIQRSCPRLKYIWTSSNGFNPGLLKKRVEEILSSVDKQKTLFLTFNISIDGIGETHNKIRGIKNGYNRSLESIRLLNEIKKEYPIDVAINTVIQPDNVTELEEIKELGSKEGVNTVFSPLVDDTYFASNNVASNLVFNEKQLKRFRDFITKTYSDSAETSSLFWLRYFLMLDGAKRKLPCAFDRYALIIEPTGDLRACTMREWTYIGNIKGKTIKEKEFVKKMKMVRYRLKREVCPTCPNYCTTDFALEKEFFTYAKYYFKKHFLQFAKP